MEHTVSSKTLIKASSTALLLAAITLMTVILPAEYNIDPSGVGKALGLTVLAGNDEIAQPDDLSRLSAVIPLIEFL